MIRCGKWPVGVCSWSLKMDIRGVIDTLDAARIDHVNLAILPAIEAGGDEYLDAVRRHRWTISSTMINFPQEDYSTLDAIRRTGGITPDDCWERNRELFFKAVEITAQLKVPYLMAHAGFIDHSDKAYARKFYDRIQCMADAAGAEDVMYLMETGQETAPDLKRFLTELNHPAVGVNLDPANMILYAKGDPIQAVRTLAPWVKHVHAKDAVRTKTPGTWGTEVPWGDGEVNTDLFLRTLRETGFDGVLSIEREMGDDRIRDIRIAAERLSRFKV
jgi:L-ribulose-5-phosphate 3-epimerase